ncbi:hypothetical protein [Streptomyces sp. NPDC102462]|uniref:hypothetical protein n=1 Tax=Streptomyces sp. NPDC102462 TaxID=3366178 RepID=UPI00380F2C44
MVMSRGRSARRGPVFVAALLCAALATGCTQDDGGTAAAAGAAGKGDGSGNWPSPQATSGLTAGLALPIQSYLVTYDQQVTVLRAQQSVQRACMKRLGFDYDPPEPGRYPPPSADDANMVRRYGIADLAQARTHGYHLAHDSGEPPAYEVASAANAALTGRNAKGAAVAGVPEGGCLGESVRRIGELDGSLASRLNNEGFDASKANPKVREVVQAWSACMRRKGYTSPTPLDAAKLADSLSAPTPSRAETDIAVADVECKKSTDLVQVWFKEETRIQDELIEKNQLALQEAKKTTEEAVRNATRAASR